jgi:hypothetical protein
MRPAIRFHQPFALLTGITVTNMNLPIFMTLMNWHWFYTLAENIFPTGNRTSVTDRSTNLKQHALNQVTTWAGLSKCLLRLYLLLGCIDGHQVSYIKGGMQCRLRIFENKILRRILEPKREANGEWRTLHDEELHS